MTDMVDIEVILDEAYPDPKVEIYTREKNDQVEAIVNAIENVSETRTPPIAVVTEGTYKVISQRDIFRIRTEARELILDTKDAFYPLKGTIGQLEEMLDPDRFCRISQSEIINLYKVDSFIYDSSGTIEVVFENGVRSWVARRRVKLLRDKLRDKFGNY